MVLSSWNEDASWRRITEVGRQRAGRMGWRAVVAEAVLTVAGQQLRRQGILLCPCPSCALRNADAAQQPGRKNVIIMCSPQCECRCSLATLVTQPAESGHQTCVECVYAWCPSGRRGQAPGGSSPPPSAPPSPAARPGAASSRFVSTSYLPHPASIRQPGEVWRRVDDLRGHLTPEVV